METKVDFTKEKIKRNLEIVMPNFTFRGACR
jgi:hypothetical protein